MDTILTRHLFDMPLKVERRHIGLTPFADRTIVTVIEASIASDRLRARLLPGGNDWVKDTPDGMRFLDCRLLFETDDGALLGMTYRGLRHASAEVMARLNRGEAVDPALFYHRVAIFFETAAPQYDAFNKMMAVGRARPGLDGAVYEVFEVL